MPLKSANPELNYGGVRPGRVIAALNLGEGSGTTLTNYAESGISLGNATLSAATWTSNSEGTQLDLTSGSYAEFPTASSADTVTGRLLEESSGVIRFIGPADTTAAHPYITINTNPTNTQGGMFLQKVITTGVLRFNYRDQKATTTHILEWSGVDYSIAHTVQWTTGPLGVRAWLDGVAGTPNGGSPSTCFAPIRIAHGQRITIGRNATTSAVCNAIITAFTMWDCQLEQFEMDKVLADPNQATREPPGQAAEIAATTAWATGLTAATGAPGTMRKPTVANRFYYEATTGGAVGGSEPTWGTVPAKTTTDNSATWTARTPSLFVGCYCLAGGRMLPTNITYYATISPWRQSTGTVYVRAYAATTISGISAATPQVFSGSTNGEPIVCQITGLSAGTRYYTLFEWSTDGTNYYPFPASIHSFVTQRTAGASFKVAKIPDGHVNAGTGSTIPDNMRDIKDVAYLADASFNTSHGYRNRMGFLKTVAEIARRTGTFDFWWGGNDFVQSDDDTATSITNTTSYIWQNWRSWMSSFCDVLTAGGGYIELGNHEGEMGHMQKLYGALQRRSTYIRLKMFPNPTATTYSEGGELNSDLDWQWAGDSAYYTTSATGLQNYYAFQHGGWLFCTVDYSRYSGLNQTTAAYVNDKHDWKIGYTQMAWFSDLCVNAKPLYGKVFSRHGRFGGIEAGQTSGTQLYGRGSTVQLFSDQDTDDFWIAKMLRDYDWTVDLYHHDHGFTHTVFHEVPAVMTGDIGTPSKTQTNAPGWNFTQRQAAHGTAESLGSLDGAGVALAPKGMVKHYNCIGFTLLEFSSSGVYTTFIQTAFGTAAVGNVENDVSKFLLQANGTAAQSYPERFLCNQTHAKDANNQISLVDSLNASPAPRHIYGVYDDPGANWWTSAQTQQYAAYSPATIDSSGSTTYAAGACVTPTIKNGWLYVSTGNTGSCNAEPTHDGTSATDWPTTRGSTITVGRTTWKAAQRYAKYPFDENHLDGTIQLLSSAGANVRPAWVPRVLYRYLHPVRTRIKLPPRTKPASKRPIVGMRFK